MGEDRNYMKRYVWLIAIGIILMVVDIPVPIGEAYPIMEINDEIGNELQLRIINNFIGKSPRVDIMPDLLGYLLVFIGCLLLVKKNWRFIMPMLLIPFSAYIYIMLPRLPYDNQLSDMYLKVAGLNLLLVIIEILIEFYVIHGIVKITNCMQNKWHNNELLGGWILAMMSKAVLLVIDFFYGEGTLFILYSIVMIGLTIYYINRLFMTMGFKPEVDDND